MRSDVIIAPLISEKSMKDVASSKFTFRVDKGADKNQIRKVIEDKFKVHVLSVSTVVIKGKTKRAGTKRTIVKKSVWKKAIVTLKKGEKIPLFEAGA